MSSTDTNAVLHFDETVAPLARPTTPEVEAILGVPIRLLDHGFVRLVDYLGDDAAIVQAARVSYGLGTKKRSEDHALIRYLMRHRHTSPFEMVETKFHIKAPIFVARQWLRHRTACLAGDTVLSFNLPGRGAQPHQGMAIAQFHRLWEQSASHAPLRERLCALPLRMCDERTGEIRQTQVTGIWQTGVKPVFKVTLANGKSLKMTKDHRCLTEAGWLTLEQATGLRRDAAGAVVWERDAPALATNGVPAHRSAEWLGAQLGAGRGVAAIAAEAGVTTRTARKWLRLHGLDATVALAEGATQPAAHRRPRTTRLFRGWSRIVAIADAGEEMTYDLSVAGPYHNFVANGVIVHNSVNEISARYSLLPEELYIPEDAQISFQSADNKQGRSTVEVPDELRERVRALLLAGQRESYAGYQELVDAEIARELARIALPVSIYTEWYWKLNLHNLFHFLSLRLDAHAQYEIRIYAEAIGLIAQRLTPVAYKAFVDYQRDAALLSGPERAIVAKALRGEPIEAEDWQRIGKRERAEFARKFGLDESVVPTSVAPGAAQGGGNGHAG